MLQHPGATHVAGYRTWQQLGRQVRKGEKGIGILAPMPIKEERENPTTGDTEKVQTRIYFKPVHVFDISQTDGEAPPPRPDWQGEGRNPDLESALVDYCTDHGIKVDQTQYTGGALGWTMLGSITYTTEGNVPRTLAHELAHVLTPQWRQEMGKATTEALVDLVAAIVCQHFDVDATDSSAAYIATWSKDPDQLLPSLEKAQRIAHKIITELEARVSPQDQEGGDSQ